MKAYVDGCDRFMKIPNIDELKKYGLNDKRNQQIVVYILYLKNKIIYIGQTHDIDGRISQHKTDKYFTSFSYFPVHDQTEALALEWYLIKKYMPLFNDHDGRSYKAFEYFMNEELKNKYSVYHRAYISENDFHDIVSKEYDDGPSCLTEKEKYEMRFKGLNLLDFIDGKGHFVHDCIERLNDLISIISPEMLIEVPLNFKRKLRLVNGSLVLTIPKPLCDLFKFHNGDKLNIEPGVGELRLVRSTEEDKKSNQP